MLMYEIKGLEKEYEGKKVLEIEHLQLEKGNIYGIIGPSGVGKSTLLRILNLLEKPDAGEIYYQDRLVGDNKKERLNLRLSMTMVFQHPTVFNDTVYNNIAYGLRIRKIKSKEIQAKVRNALEFLDMEGYEKRQALTLSGGEAQRVSLARAIVLEPSVLLLDEPTASLDPYNVSVLENIIQYLNEKKGITIILVTHNMFQAKRLAHETIFLSEGQIIEKQPTQDFFNNPKDERTKAFIEGKMIY